MTAGGVRLPVMVEQCVGERVDFGLDTSEWTLFREPWAKIRPVAGGEANVNDQLQQLTTHVLEIRFDKDKVVTSDMRIRYGSRIFEIVKAWDADERGEYQMLECVELGAAGGDA